LSSHHDRIISLHEPVARMDITSTCVLA
jgi:hypothetical protein